MITDEIKNVYQGEDLKLSVTILDSNGMPLDLTVTGCKVYVTINDGYRTPRAKYKSGDPSSGWIILYPGDFATGLMHFFVMSDVTGAMLPGKYYIEARIRYISGTAPDDNYFDKVVKAYAFSIIRSDTNNLTLP